MTQIEYRWCAPVRSTAEQGLPEPRYSMSREAGMLIERNVTIEMRDGALLQADVFRPSDLESVPVLMCWTTYGKHQNGQLESRPGAGVPAGAVSKYATFEGADPAVWVPKGFGVVNVDKRGSYFSQGDATFASPEEARDFYDAIEWAGEQSWSNGRVGLTGVSYLACRQWQVAALHPAHLAAINPWEGWSDPYREVVRHGGIPETWFWLARVLERWGVGAHRVEDLVAETKEHPLWDSFWKSKTPVLEEITVPALVVASWGDQGLHLRGTLEGFKRIRSPEKWLIVHGGKKWAYYYEPSNVERLAAFFDRFLRDGSNDLTEWPRVQVQARTSGMDGPNLSFGEWPSEKSEYKRWYLDAETASLSTQCRKGASSLSYDSLGSGPDDHQAVFELKFAEPMTLIGHSKLRVWMSIDEGDDLDLFVGLYKYGSDGSRTPLVYYAAFDDGPVALGWLRASHRDLDEIASTEWQPVLRHTRETVVPVGSPFPLDVEIWPSGTQFDAGETLRLVLQGTDLQKYSKTARPVQIRHEDLRNVGTHHVWTGEQYPSYLLLPVIG